MMKKIAVVVLLVAVLALAVPAAASPPNEVHIEVEAHAFPERGNFGPFVASGPAVDNGVICPSGDTGDLSNRVKFLKDGRGIKVRLHRQYTCDDGSGSFIMDLKARILFNPREVSGRWKIISGTGAYENLRGSGALTDSILITSEPLVVLDLLDGRIKAK